MAKTRVSAHGGPMLHALQRAVSSLGHCEPPVRVGAQRGTPHRGGKRDMGGLARALAYHFCAHTEGCEA